MALKCILVDDEQLARTLLKNYIQKMPELDLIGEFKNPLDALAKLRESEVDLMFLDIQMPNITGIELLRSLKAKPMVVFTTAYAEFALEGYQLDVIDYLLKPFTFERFLQATNKALELHALKQSGKSDTRDFVTVRADHKIHKIYLDDILYIEGLKEYVSYYTETARIIVLQSLKGLEETLPSDKFLRIHKSYIVPVERIKAMDGNQVEIGDKKIPIGRSYKEIVTERVFKQ